MRILMVAAIVALALAVNAGGRYGFSMVELAISMVDPSVDTIVDDVDWGIGVAQFDDVDWGVDLAESTNSGRSALDLLNRLFGG